jgi:hypothetical protein
VGKPEGKRPLGRPRCRWVDSIKMDLRDIGWDGVGWIDMLQDRDHWRDLVNTAMLGSSCVAAQFAAPQEGLSSVSEQLECRH